MSFFTKTTSARLRAQPSHVDPYQLYELRRPYDRASNVVPQLPRQPDYAHTRLRYRRIISSSPANSPSSVPPEANFPAAFRPARAYSFSSSDLSSFSFTSKSSGVRADKAGIPIVTRKGGLRRCIQHVNRVSPFRRSFRRTTEIDTLRMNKHEAAKDISSDFDISSDEDEPSFEEYRERRRNSLALPSSPLNQDNRLTRMNTAPVVIGDLHKPAENDFKFKSPSSHPTRPFSLLHKKPAPKLEQRRFTPRESFPCTAQNSSPDRVHRTYSAHSPNNECDRPLPNPPMQSNKAFSNLSQFSLKDADHREAYIRHSRTFYVSTMDPNELSVSFVLPEPKNKSSNKLLRKVMHAFHAVRIRAA